MLTFPSKKPSFAIQQDAGSMDKRQMTLMLSDREMDVLEQLAADRGLSKTALLRQALRLYQSVTERVKNGEKLYLEHPSTKEKAELVVI